jgi:DNA repair protein RadD
VVAVSLAAGQRTHWLSHRRELVSQAAARISERLGALSVGLIHPQAPSTPYAEVQVASVQTLLARPSSAWPKAKLVVLDECHHFCSDDWRTLVEHYPNERVLGLTATPERGDGRPLGDIFDKLVVAATHKELIRDGWLLPCTVFAPAKVLGAALALDPVEAYRRHADNDLAFVFAGSVPQARELAQRFSEAGYPAQMVAGVTSTGARASALRRFAAGELRVLTTVIALTEGIDLPAARVCILARGCGHVTPYLQLVGRVLRPHPTMASAIFIDLPGVSSTFGHPTEDRVYSLEGKGIRRASEESLFTCIHCGVVVPRSEVHSGCPECGRAASTEGVSRAKPPRIYSMELRSLYAGEGTPESAKVAEYKRLRDVARDHSYSLEWVRREYRLLFGSDPPLDDVSEDHRRRTLASFQELARQNNYKPAYAAVRYKKLFGSWPPRHWGQSHA